MAWDKDHWIRLGNKREQAFKEIAKALGEKHPITQMIGTLAWGRHEWELGVKATLANAIARASALDGYFHALNLWARDHSTDAQRTMIKIWYAEEG